MPKPFTLDSVLKYRKQREERAAARLAKAVQQEKVAKDALMTLQAEWQKISDELTHLEETGVEIGTLIRYSNRKDFLLQQVHICETACLRAREATEAARKETAERGREKKVLERLREKQNMEYARYLEHLETLRLDEVAVLAYDRKNRE